MVNYDAAIKRHDEALRFVAQSHLIHPDWDLEMHLVALEDHGIDADDEATVVAWPNGPSTAAVRDYVAMWIRHPDRCLQ